MTPDRFTVDDYLRYVEGELPARRAADLEAYVAATSPSLLVVVAGDVDADEIASTAAARDVPVLWIGPRHSLAGTTSATGSAEFVRRGGRSTERSSRRTVRPAPPRR